MFTQDVIEQIDNYVYRLIDPRNFQTFYVGRGIGNRVFQHAKEELKYMERDEDEDDLKLKIKIIREIRRAGKEVICVIHRFGLTKEHAMEVESALIDCYSGLTNLVSGYSSDRGVITTDDLQANIGRLVYKEPEGIEYVIIKTSNSAINANGDLYEATRRAWHASLDHASKYHIVLSVIGGIVQEVYEVDKWYRSAEDEHRIEFDGHVAPDDIATLFRNKRIPECYRKKGMARPFLYKQQPNGECRKSNKE